MKNEIKLDFQLLGTQVPPQEITKLTGVAPDTELLRGQRSKERDLPRQSIWSVETHLKSDDVLDHWRALEKLLDGPKDLLKKIGESGRVKITIVVNGNARLPSITIPTSMAEFAAYVGAVIDIDHLQ